MLALFLTLELLNKCCSNSIVIEQPLWDTTNVSVSIAFPFFLDLSLLVNLSAILIYYILGVMHFPCRVTGRSYPLLGGYSVPGLHKVLSSSVVSQLIFTMTFGVSSINHSPIYAQIKILRSKKTFLKSHSQ